ncbi:MAG TPA: hypothetical protein VH253_13195 [Phycisphaerae bacterium]|nr:hypothetical protein [Phycisphaerae bacterium]
MSRTFIRISIQIAAASITSAAPAESTRAPDARIVSVQFTDQHRGWERTDQGLLRTDDGGRTWRTVLANAPWSGERGSGWYFSHDWHAIDAQQAWVAFAAASGKIHFRRTTDAGNHWSDAIVATESLDVLAVNVSFADPQHGWILVIPEHTMNSSPGALYRTLDGGTHWREIGSIEMPGSPPKGLPRGGNITFLDAHTGWLVGADTSTTPCDMCVTHDGGATWQQVQLERPADLTGDLDVLAPPVFLNPTEGRLGVRVGEAEALYATHDAGKHWQAIAVTRSTGQFDFLTPREAWIWRTAAPLHNIPTGPLLHTTDAGHSWQPLRGPQSLEHILQKNETVTELTFIDPHHGWACIQNDTTTRLVHTTDGGATWAAE